ncbi:MAG TPA: hypothetical protein VJ846_00510, partial [Sphingomicrobium sp.]|nr:hypothetical protein [Sphingomicrobium sp.]
MRRSRNSYSAPRLLIAAIAGRGLQVIEGRSSNAAVYFDGRNLVVPRDADLSELAKPLMAQSALFAIGSFDRSTLQRIALRPNSADRYLVLEAWRAAAELDDLLPKHLLGRAPVDKRAPKTREESSRRAFGRETLPQPTASLGTLRPLLVLGVRHPLEPSAIVHETQVFEAEQTDDESDTNSLGSAGFLKAISNVGRAGGLLSELARILLGLGRGSGTEQPDGFDNGEIAAHTSATEPRTAIPVLLSRVTGRHACTSKQSSSGMFRYPEWDAGAREYRPEWASVIEASPEASDDRLDRARVLIQPRRSLDQSLARIALGYEPHRRQPDGSDLMVDALVSLMVDVRSGHAADDRIYRRRRKTRRDLGVLILIDCSSSIESLDADDCSVHEIQVCAAFQMATSLGSLGDRTAIAAFRSWGRGHTYYQTVKRFDERLDGKTRERMLGLTPSGFTRMGAAIRHGTHRLVEDSGTPNRILLLMTDGVAFDRDGYESKSAEEDVRRAVAEGRATGCATICLSMGNIGDIDRNIAMFGRGAVLQTDLAGLERGIGETMRSVLQSLETSPSKSL